MARWSQLIPTLLLPLCLAAACGEDGEPHPGYADPCSTAMGAVLGCPAGSSQLPAGQATIEQACDRLVSCGLLAAEFLGRRGQDCSKSSDCEGGQCLSTDNGDHCYYPWLDFRWCVQRLSEPDDDPCTGSLDYTAEHVDSAVSCMMQTPCATLGLPFDLKRQGSDHRPDLDKYTCPNGERSIWTATICDHGLLDY